MSGFILLVLPKSKKDSVTIDLAPIIDLTVLIKFSDEVLYSLALWLISEGISFLIASNTSGVNESIETPSWFNRLAGFL